MTFAVIGASGFVGQAIADHLESTGRPVTRIVRDNYASWIGTDFDVVINCSNNSRKPFAENEPGTEFDASVRQQLRVMIDFPSGTHVLMSSVDVYARLDHPEFNAEDTPIRPEQPGHYGFHKRLAEQIVQHYADRWLVIRLAGMVGKGLRKNPVFDILNRQPIWIHPDSQYQFMNTEDVAKAVVKLIDEGQIGQIFNCAGRGLVSPREIAEWAGVPLDLSKFDPSAEPRIVHINTDKLNRVHPLPESELTVRSFVENPPRS